MREKKIYRLGFLGTLTVKAENPQSASRNFKKWLQTCPEGNINITYLPEYRMANLTEKLKAEEYSEIFCAYDPKTEMETIAPPAQDMFYAKKTSDVRIRLSDYYYTALNHAKEHGNNIVLFPDVSINENEYSIKEIADTAMSTLSAWLCENSTYMMKAGICCNNKKNYDFYEEYIKAGYGYV